MNYFMPRADYKQNKTLANEDLAQLRFHPILFYGSLVKLAKVFLSI